MKSLILFTSITLSLYFGGLNAQTNTKAVQENWTTYNSKAVYENGTIHLNHLRNDGEGSALLWLKESNFKDGSIELDIKGKDVRGQSFVGLAFHGLDNSHYDAVYFRPFNFKSPEKKDNAVQYIDSPDNGFYELRKKFPGKYENAVRPVPDPNDWFHVKIEITGKKVEVYLEGSNEPTLTVEKLNDRSQGMIGLWMDSMDGWFRNLTVKDR
ncbi:family 16 glycoside hydrolase [Ulvibacterium marinum]|uniref:DUF1080 domain-containing protein n=1 Tax=Ulvibacterium marinum TaxID=2419782 RepID=A0A3B0C621_9FLAO|nr:family 16 glycoside hydrolase [Ulvibacterium marinum]RKN79409.1 DUF1080 domain-containing protein [Ulvibacterium marinum]